VDLIATFVDNGGPQVQGAVNDQVNDQVYARGSMRSAFRCTLPRMPSFKVALFVLCALASACTQEQQNKLRRDVQNWTGTNGVLEIYAGDKVVRRFLKVDKLSTAYGTDDRTPRPYRYGYGVLDENLNGTTDREERRVYFELSEYSTMYLFFESPR